MNRDGWLVVYTTCNDTTIPLAYFPKRQGTSTVDTGWRAVNAYKFAYYCETGILPMIVTRNYNERPLP